MPFLVSRLVMVAKCYAFPISFLILRIDALRVQD